MHVPLTNLAQEHALIAGDLSDAFDRVLRGSNYILGAEVEAFEAEFARFSKVDHCVSLANGTDALELGLRALSIGPGDEVLVPALTFIATALAVLRCGAVPRFVDVDPTYLLLEPQLAAAAVTGRTRAIIPVHLYGQAAPCEDLADLCAPCVILEDAAQAQGAERCGKPVGALGSMAATSFYPTKNLGALGDAGAILTDDSRLAGKVRRLRNYGSDTKYSHPSIGFNSRLDELQAALLRVKLKGLADRNASRIRAAEYYGANLSSVDHLEVPATIAGNLHVWHLYVVRLRDQAGARRDRVLRRLHQAGIQAGIHYPMPAHLHGAFSDLGYRQGDFPVAENATSRMLSLPLFPGISARQQDYVINCLVAALNP